MQRTVVILDCKGLGTGHICANHIYGQNVTAQRKIIVQFVLDVKGTGADNLVARESAVYHFVHIAPSSRKIQVVLKIFILCIRQQGKASFQVLLP